MQYYVSKTFILMKEKWLIYVMYFVLTCPTIQHCKRYERNRHFALLLQYSAVKQ